MYNFLLINIHQINSSNGLIIYNFIVSFKRKGTGGALFLAIQRQLGY